jgi:hypothetical protein
MDTGLLDHILHAERRAFLIVMIAGLALAPAKVSAGAVAGQSCQYGGGAGSPIGGLPAAGGSIFTVVQCQSGGTYGYPIVTLQNAAAAAGSSCTGYDPGALRYNTTLSNVEMCNGTNWEFLAASTSACGTPSGLSFTNVTNATLNTMYTSSAATITFSGCTSGGLSVSVTGAATAQISINGGAWTTSGSISSGQTLQVRLTSSGSVSTGLTATVTVGSSSTNWTVTTRSGALQVFMTSTSYVGGTIGGISGANTICQAVANAAGYSGTYVAILSDNSTSAASNLTLSYPIVNAYDGSTVAAANLWSGPEPQQLEEYKAEKHVVIGVTAALPVKRASEEAPIVLGLITVRRLMLIAAPAPWACIASSSDQTCSPQQVRGPGARRAAPRAAMRLGHPVTPPHAAKIKTFAPRRHSRPVAIVGFMRHIAGLATSFCSCPFLSTLAKLGYVQ